MTETGSNSGPDEAAARELADLLAGLEATPKRVSSKYFYDQRGSELFELITRLPEYYLTRTERRLLTASASRWTDELTPRSLVELGAGSAEKTRILLDALVRVPSKGRGPVYVPIDVSSDFLASTAEALRSEYPSLRVRPLVGDMSEPGFHLDIEAPQPVLFALLGSTIGNFTGPQAVELISAVRRSMDRSDAFLMGADLRPGEGKSAEELHAAYNDPEGVTAAFNLNLLSVLNRRFEGDFRHRDFEHRAFYDSGRHRIEMHLVARRPLAVTVAGRRIEFHEGESLRTEISCKYDRAAVSEMFLESGLRLADWVTDTRGRYGLALGRLR